MFTYTYFGTNDLERAIRFYNPVMAVLGHRRCSTGDGEWDLVAAGWGSYERGGVEELACGWENPSISGRPRPATAGNGSMIALAAKSWRQVDEFHAAALAAGGVSEGAPGLRPHYNPDFYACYVRDPDGNKLAVVCRGFTAPQG